MTASRDTDLAAPKRDPLYFVRALFIRLGVLPFLLVIAVIVFTLLSGNFLSSCRHGRGVSRAGANAWRLWTIRLPDSHKGPEVSRRDHGWSERRPDTW